MQIEQMEVSQREPEFCFGLAVDKGRRFRFIAAVADGEVARLEIWNGEAWVIDTEPPPFTLVPLIRERLGIEKPVYAEGLPPRD